jgi:hypothetical protein
MLRRVRGVGEWYERKRAASDLSRPLTYRGVLRFMFWQGAPALAGPLVIVAYQFAVNGDAALVVFGSGSALFALTVLGAVARRRGRPVEVGAFVVAWLAVAAGGALWAADSGYAGIGAWIVGFFGFGSVLAGAAASVALQNQLRE